MKLIHYPTYVSCSYCNKSFKTDLYLRRHVLSCHEAKSVNYNNSAYASYKSAGDRSDRYNQSSVSVKFKT